MTDHILHLGQAGIPVPPYRSQWDTDAGRFASDCGPACLGMILDWVGIFGKVPIDQIALLSNQVAHPGYTLPGDLIKAAVQLGVKIKRVLNLSLEALRAETMRDRRPLIVLVHYGTLRALPTQDQKFSGGHWLVVFAIDADFVYVNDPNWRDARRDQGCGLRIPVKMFEQAMSDCVLDGNTRNQGLMIDLPDLPEWAEPVTPRRIRAGETLKIERMDRGLDVGLVE